MSGWVQITARAPPRSRARRRARIRTDRAVQSALAPGAVGGARRWAHEQLRSMRWPTRWRSGEGAPALVMSGLVTNARQLAGAGVRPCGLDEPRPPPTRPPTMPPRGGGLDGGGVRCAVHGAFPVRDRDTGMTPSKGMKMRGELGSGPTAVARAGAPAGRGPADTDSGVGAKPVRGRCGAAPGCGHRRGDPWGRTVADERLLAAVTRYGLRPASSTATPRWRALPGTARWRQPSVPATPSSWPPPPGTWPTRCGPTVQLDASVRW